MSQASVGSDESSFSVSTISSEVSEAGHDSQKLRAKARLYKKKLEAAEKRIAEKEEKIKVSILKMGGGLNKMLKKNQIFKCREIQKVNFTKYSKVCFLVKICFC